ncbi:MAG: sugar phosphate isomerase/epimerase [Lentisphaeria bacterium]|nr:sugar phosphate isomerase/epimerase [Lentisphaeria bacterium]
MYRNLSPGAVGIRGTTEEIAALAARNRFGGMDLNAGEAAALLESGGLDTLVRLYETHGLRPGGFGLPVDFRRDEATFEKGLADLPRLARAAAALGCSRCPTWIMPASDELAFAENFEQHRRRLRACAEILRDHDIRLGLEFVGPLTSRARKRHAFVWNQKGMLELAAAIGTGNVGLLLDCWHWYTSRGSVEELLALTPEQVVYVHVSDAPGGVPVDEQIDNVREMPAATGIIDIAAFLGALKHVGYDGPVTAEPFRKELAALPAEQAAALVAMSLERCFSLAGIP